MGQQEEETVLFRHSAKKTPHIPDGWEEKISKHDDMITQRFWHRLGNGREPEEETKMSKKHMGNWEGETELIKETPGTDSECGLENVWTPSTPHKVISMSSHKDVT